MSVHRFIANNRNDFVTAAVAASSVKTAANAVFPGAPQRADNSRGTVALTGSYSGAADATFDVEIVGSASTTSRASAPIFAGAGSSTIDNLAVTDSVAPQTFTLVLKSLGVDAKKAAVDFYGVKLRAKDTGTDGNDINLSVNTSGISKTSLNVATLSELPAASDGTDHTRVVGAEWDFGGAYELTADGDLNSATKRIAFGADPQVYRSWRTTEQGQEVYYFDPPIARDVPAETIVYEVTGSYTVTVTDGSTPEVYSSIITLYDLLANLVTSGHVDVDGVIVEDRTPGGMAVDELPLRTASFALAPETAGGAYVTELEDVTVGASAVTQTVEIECTSNDTLGAEVWSVNGSVSGALANAVTDALYSSGSGVTAFGFKIPRKIPGGFPTTGSINITSHSFAGDPPPHLCDDLFRPVVGINATNKTFTLTWTARPGEECDCEALKGAVVGGPNAECLGVDVRALGVSTDDYRYRQLVSQHQKNLSTFMAAQTLAGTSLAAADQLDQQLAELADKQVHFALGTIFGNANAVLDYTARANDTAYALGDYIEVSGDVFVCSTAGTSDSSPPSFDTTDYGDTTTDGTAVWTYFSEAPLVAALGLINQVNTDLATWDGIDVPTVDNWEPSVTHQSGDLVQPQTANGHIYMALNQGSTDATTEPTFPTNGSTVIDNAGDNQIIWEDQGEMAGDSIKITAGVTSTALAIKGQSYALGDYAKKWREMAYEVIAAAQVDLGKAEAGGEGDTCWQDDPSAGFYFAVTDGTRNYMPLFPNRYWHSARRVTEPETGDTSIQSTKEAGFAILMCDEALLAEGDTIGITISDVVQARSYQVGDQFRLPIINRSPLYLQGGVTGDDTHTWGVRGTVDGALDDYAVVHGSEGAYSDGGVTWDAIYRGATPNQVGDKFTFAVERTQFRWRKDGGSYSSAADITAAAISLSDGLSVVFSGGAGVSFENGDLFPFSVRQPYAPAHVQAGNSDSWQWTGATADITLTAAADKTIDAVCIGRHTIPEGATITARGLDVSDVEQWSQVLTWQRGPIVHVFSSDQVCRKLKIELADATGGTIAWLWAGLALDFAYNATDITLTRDYLMSRAGTRGRSRYIGRGAGGEIRWENWFKQTDADNLYDLLDHIKEQGNEPIVFLPHSSYTAEARLVQIEEDQISVQDRLAFHPEDEARRLLSVQLPLTAVIS